MEATRANFSTAARIGCALSAVGVALALVLDGASPVVQTSSVLAMMIAAFTASLSATGDRDHHREASAPVPSGTSTTG